MPSIYSSQAYKKWTLVEKIVIEKNELLIFKNLFQYFKNPRPPTLAPYVDYLLLLFFQLEPLLSLICLFLFHPLFMRNQVGGHQMR